MTPGRTIRLVGPDEAALSWLAELRTWLSALGDLVEKPVEIVQLVRDLPRGAAAFHLESSPTGNADEYRLILKPSEALLGLMAAMRTLERAT